MNFKKNKYLKQIGILTRYLVISLIMTYPLVVHLKDATLGASRNDLWGDEANVIGNGWKMKTSVLGLTNPFVAEDTPYPIGNKLIMHAYSPLNSLLVLPVALFSSNYYLAVNVILIFFAFTVAAYGMYLLSLYLTGSHIASFISGIIFSFCPYKLMSGVGHLNISSVQWIPFFVLSLVKLIREDKDKINAFLAALFLVCSLFTGYYPFFCSVIFAVIYLPLSMFRPSAQSRRRKIDLFIFFALLLLIPSYGAPLIFAK